MASIALSARTVLINGVATDSGATSTSADTITITAPTGTTLDSSNMVIRLSVGATSTAGLAILAGSTYSSTGLPAYTFTITSSQTIYVGGKDFETARFLNSSAQTIVLRQSGACVINAEVVQLPNGFTA